MARPMHSLFGLNGGQAFEFNAVTFTKVLPTHNLLQLTQTLADMTSVKVSGGNLAAAHRSQALCRGGAGLAEEKVEEEEEEEEEKHHNMVMPGWTDRHVVIILTLAMCLYFK